MRLRPLRALHLLRTVAVKRRRQSGDADLLAGYGAAILLDGLVSGPLVMPVSQLWLAIYAGLAWGWCSRFP